MRNPKHWQLPSGKYENVDGKTIPVDMEDSFWNLYKSYGWNTQSEWQNGWIYGTNNETTWEPPFYYTYNGVSVWLELPSSVEWGIGGLGESVRLWAKTISYDTTNANDLRPYDQFIFANAFHMVNSAQRRDAFPLRCLTQ